jgi:ferredoxin
MATIPMIRLSGGVESNWHPNLIRPPGALSEKEFLARCIKCGQCMRICPTNVIHPLGMIGAGIIGGLESLWTPALNFRIGTSGCQRNCIACGYICPTAAIRPITLDERIGINQYAATGPIKIGTAFVDQGRCLPWSMDKPCIVCQENCPVSPKAILIREHFAVIPILNPSQHSGHSSKPASKSLVVKKSESLYIEFESNLLRPDYFSTGDYFCRAQGEKDDSLRLIVRNTANSLSISPEIPWEQPFGFGTKTEILIRLQRPYIEPNRCIGCGVCEHECPVRGKPAIRVTSENESRNREHALIL